jgi:thiamine pyrophosphokinase
MKKRIIIVANGVLYPQIIKEIQKTDFIIGVDRAAYWLIEHGVVPSIAIGDFDSTSRGEFEKIHTVISAVKIYSPEKDFTDTELAVNYAIKQRPSSIVVYGGVGTRLDHTFGTLLLLERCQKFGILAVFRDQTNEAAVVGRGRTILKKREGSRYVSVVPITNSIQISLSGFKYEISKKTIIRGQTIGISNEFINKQATITIHRGLAFIIQSRD